MSSYLRKGHHSLANKTSLDTLRTSKVKEYMQLIHFICKTELHWSKYKKKKKQDPVLTKYLFPLPPDIRIQYVVSVNLFFPTLEEGTSSAPNTSS